MFLADTQRLDAILAEDISVIQCKGHGSYLLVVLVRQDEHEGVGAGRIGGRNIPIHIALDQRQLNLFALLLRLVFGSDFDATRSRLVERNIQLFVFCKLTVFLLDGDRNRYILGRIIIVGRQGQLDRLHFSGFDAGIRHLRVTVHHKYIIRQIHLHFHILRIAVFGVLEVEGKCKRLHLTDLARVGGDIIIDHLQIGRFISLSGHRDIKRSYSPPAGFHDLNRERDITAFDGIGSRDRDTHFRSLVHVDS